MLDWYYPIKIPCGRIVVDDQKELLSRLSQEILNKDGVLVGRIHVDQKRFWVLPSEVSRSEWTIFPRKLTKNLEFLVSFAHFSILGVIKGDTVFVYFALGVHLLVVGLIVSLFAFYDVGFAVNCLLFLLLLCAWFGWRSVVKFKRFVAFI